MNPETTIYRVWYHLLNSSIRSFGTPLQYYDQLYYVKRKSVLWLVHVHKLSWNDRLGGFGKLE